MKKSSLVIAAISALTLGTFATPAMATEVTGFVPTGELLYAGAGPRSVLADMQLADNSPVTENGIAWYNYDSFAFTAAGSTVNTNSCDTNPGQNLMCWHDEVDEGGRYFNTGYNYLQLQDITATNGVYRVMYHSDDPGYYPSGDQVDVPVSELDGWELCWVDDWGSEDEYLSPSIYVDDLLEQCSGDYLLFAVADDVTAAAEEDSLADTGVDASVLFGAGIVAVAAGALVLRRRRTN